MNPLLHSTRSPLSSIRRHVIASLALVTGGLLLALPGRADDPSPMKTIPTSTANATRTSLHYEIDLVGAPSAIYELLLDSKKFTALTGAPAEIDPKVGGAVSMFGGLIVARNVELIPNRRIVQAWRPAGWPEGIYSIVRFELEPYDGKTRLVLDHTGFPEGMADHLDLGWHKHYLDPLQQLLR